MLGWSSPYYQWWKDCHSRTAINKHIRQSLGNPQDCSCYTIQHSCWCMFLFGHPWCNGICEKSSTYISDACHVGQAAITTGLCLKARYSKEINRDIRTLILRHIIATLDDPEWVKCCVRLKAKRDAEKAVIKAREETRRKAIMKKELYYSQRHQYRGSKRRF